MKRKLTPATTIIGLEDLQFDLSALLDDSVWASCWTSATRTTLVDGEVAIDVMSSQPAILDTRSVVGIDLVTQTRDVDILLTQAVTGSAEVDCAVAANIEIIRGKYDVGAGDDAVDKFEGLRKPLVVNVVYDGDRVLCMRRERSELAIVASLLLFQVLLEALTVAREMGSSHLSTTCFCLAIVTAQQGELQGELSNVVVDLRFLGGRLGGSFGLGLGRQRGLARTRSRHC